MPNDARAADLHVVSYNIHLGQGLRENAVGFGRFLTHEQPFQNADLMGMQEVCGNHDGENMRMMKALLETQGPIYSHFATNGRVGAQPCDKGQAIFSRYPILARGKIFLPFVREQRVMIWVDIEVKGRPVRFYSLHLDSRAKNFFKSEAERRRQVFAVLDELHDFRKQYPQSAMIVAGDFNSWGKVYAPWTRESGIKEMLKNFDSSLKGFHVTHIVPAQLDWIFFDGAALVKSAVVRNFGYSDHRPVYADFALTPSGR